MLQVRLRHPCTDRICVFWTLGLFLCYHLKDNLIIFSFSASSQATAEANNLAAVAAAKDLYNKKMEEVSKKKERMLKVPCNTHFQIFISYPRLERSSFTPFIIQKNSLDPP